MEKMEDMKREYEETLGRVKTIKEGSIIMGKVVYVDTKEVIVDVGFKSEGVLPLAEFRRKGRKGAAAVKPGDEIEVLFLNREDEAGRLLLSHEKALIIQGWKKIQDAYQAKSVIEGKIISERKTNDGKVAGFTVEVDAIRGFLPFSAVDIDKVTNTREYIGKILELKVLEIDQKTHNVVFSRRVLLEERKEKQKERLFMSLRVGEICEGTVKTLAPFGAFVDIGGIDGLVRLNDLSWGRKKPEEVVTVGQKVKTIVLDFDKGTGKIALGLKQLKPDPWEGIAGKYAVGQKIKGKVVKIAPFGAFVELEEGIEGLARLEDLTWDRAAKSPSEIFKEGDTVEFQVLTLNKEERKLGLGLKQILPDPWVIASEKYPPGTKVKGRVVKLTSYGAFVKIDNGVDGLLRIKDISWTKKLKHPSELLIKGKDIDAVVLRVDRETKKIALGMKQLEHSPWDDFRRGMHVKGKVTKIDTYGVVVQLDAEAEIDGFIHVSELSTKFIETPSDVVSLGQELDVKVIGVSPKDKKVELSLKGFTVDQEKAEVSTFINTQEKDTFTLGDILKMQKEKKGNK